MELEGFRKFEEARLMCRIPTKTRKETLEELGIASPLIVTVYFGRYSHQKIKIVNTNKDAQVLAISPSTTLVDGMKVISGHPETQNVIAASNLVIAKPGHSIVSECAKFRRPMYLLTSNYPEGNVLTKKSLELSLAREIDFHDAGFPNIEIPSLGELEEMKNKIEKNAIRSIEKLRSPAEIIKEYVT